MLESNPDAKATGSETKSHNEATAQQAPASAPVPINPTVPEALGVQCDDDFVPPPSPDYKPRVADPDGLAKSFVGIEVFYDPSCRQFALDIYHCLQIPGCIDSPNNKSELGGVLLRPGLMLSRRGCRHRLWQNSGAKYCRGNQDR